MRFLHTSDWHLGRSLFGHSRADEQRAFVDWVVDLAAAREVEAVVISGDVYDRAVPPLESVTLLERTLTALVAICPVIVIAGNHDSPTRLGFGGPLLEQARLHLRSSLRDLDRPVEIAGADGAAVSLYGIPYLEPDIHRADLGAERSHHDVLARAMDRVRADAATRDARTVVLAHAFVTGGAASESERDLRVGGIGDAPASVFDGVDYVALGHLHGPQVVSASSASTVAAYAGSPLAYSFSEESHVKSVAIVDLPASGPATVERVPVPVARQLATLTGTLDEIMSDPDHEVLADSWLRVLYTDPRRSADAMGRLGTRFAHVVSAHHSPPRDDGDQPETERRPGFGEVSPMAVIEGFIEKVTGTEASPHELAVFAESVERVRVEAVPR